MNHRTILGFAILWFCAACKGPQDSAVFAPTDQPVGVRLGQRLGEVRKSRAQAVFDPYDGWGESFPGDSLFRGVGYVFSSTLGLKRTPLDDWRRLKMVIYYGRSPGGALPVLQLLTARLGGAHTVGCQKAILEDEQVAVMAWRANGQIIVLQVLMTVSGNSIVGYPVVKVAPESTRLSTVIEQQLASTCRVHLAPTAAVRGRVPQVVDSESSHRRGEFRQLGRKESRGTVPSEISGHLGDSCCSSPISCRSLRMAG